jgi:GT2 family glycosyltransferase
MVVEFAALDRDALDFGSLHTRLRKGPPVAVVVPVHNGGEAVRKSIDALLTHTEPSARILIIDDASTDKEIIAHLDSVAAAGCAELIRHNTNVGYTRTVNEGIALTAPADVVLLNSDATVGPLWLQRLVWVAGSSDRIGTVSAVSDHAGTMSIPEPHVFNSWLVRREWDEVARHLGRDMPIWALEVPAAHGFCLFIRRQLLLDIGSFDVDAFPYGYGEEVDFSQRAIAAGWSNVMAPHVIVRHWRSQSFGVDRRSELVAQSKPVLRQRYPRLEDDVADWATSVGDLRMRRVARRLQRLISPHPLTSRVLTVTQKHGATGSESVDSAVIGDALITVSDSVTAEELTKRWPRRVSMSSAFTQLIIELNVEGVCFLGTSELGRRVRSVARALRIPEV